MTPLEAQRIAAAAQKAPAGSLSGRRKGSMQDLRLPTKGEMDEEVHSRESPWALCHTRESSVHSKPRIHATIEGVGVKN